MIKFLETVEKKIGIPFIILNVVFIPIMFVGFVSILELIAVFIGASLGIQQRAVLIICFEIVFAVISLIFAVVVIRKSKDEHHNISIRALFYIIIAVEYVAMFYLNTFGLFRLPLY